MDSTQNDVASPGPSSAMLITSMALGAGNVGFAAGVFGSAVGNLSFYAATATGVSTGAGAFVIGLTIAAFLKKGGGT
ncbi:hypothetical protein AB0K80_33665 [Streptomyces sp. NPDC052682]|uniref:hypothetical protein n=1 Tax=Streptomyces sp. NPDC052682 TaxID=3154954 RepID=UPI00341B89BE